MKLSVLAGAATLAAAAALPSQADAGGFAFSIGGPGGGFTYTNGIRPYGGYYPVGYGRGYHRHPAYLPVYSPPVVYGRGPYWGGYPGYYAPPVYYPAPVYYPPVYHGHRHW